jgi:hypothetical protein
VIPFLAMILGEGEQSYWKFDANYVNRLSLCYVKWTPQPFTIYVGNEFSSNYVFPRGWSADKIMQLSSDHVTAGLAAEVSECVRFAVDGHVHLYTAETAASRVKNACRNLLERVRGTDQRRVLPTLLVLDTSRFEVFSRLYESAPRQGNNGFVKAADEYGLFMVENGLVTGLLVGGVQIAACEGFEVLGIGCNVPIQDNLATGKIVADILAAGGMPVLPWAFGKWVGARGRKVIRLLGSDDGRSILLGDNALRPMPSPRPRQFRLAEEMEKPILPGSDPLPLDGDATRIGSYGFELDGNLCSSEPISSFLRELTNMRRQPTTIGRRLGWTASLLTQLKLRFAKTQCAS